MAYQAIYEFDIFIDVLSGGYLLLAIVWAVLCQSSVVLLIVTVSGVDPTVPRPLSGTFEVGVFAVRGCVSFEMAEGASGFDIGPVAWECRRALSSTYPNRHPSFFVQVPHPTFKIVGVLYFLYDAEDPSSGACCKKTVGRSRSFGPALILGRAVSASFGKCEFFKLLDPIVPCAELGA